MAYEAGVKFSEIPTSVISANEADASISFVIGTAPINMTDTTNVNKIGMYYGKTEAVPKCGYVPAGKLDAAGNKHYEYSICEAMDVLFGLYGVKPVVFVNVLDPEKEEHRKAAETKSVTLHPVSGSVTVKETGILLDTVVIGSNTKNDDYVLSFDDDGYLVVSALTDSNGDYKMDTDTALTFTAEKLNPAGVTVDDIIGGVDVLGNKSGIELIAEMYPKYAKVPGFIIAPGFSDDSAVSAIMAAKTERLNGQFSCTALTDMPMDGQEIKVYTDATEWKNKNNIVDKRQRVFYGKIALGGVVYHQSLHYAGLSAQVDADNGGDPVENASNKNYQMDSLVDDNGKEIWLDDDQATYLRGNGIITAVNGNGGWRCWGSQTAAFPANTDVKDADSAVRRMFDMIGNTICMAYRQKVDKPMNIRQIQTVTESMNIWLNGLVGKGHLLGARVEFIEEENPTTELLAGNAMFHVYITTPPTNKKIGVTAEYDTTYLATLFG